MSLFYQLILFVVASCFFISCCCLHNDSSAIESEYDWSSAVAKWYGPPNGAGSQGGACGYRDTVSKSPYNSVVSSGSPYLYKYGKGCGECYQVKCTNNSACSRSPVTVTITDECGGCRDGVHFVLSGSAMGALASPHKEDQLRKAGVLQISYRRVNCNYGKKGLAFRVGLGSNPYYLEMVVEYENGDGNLSSVELRQNTGGWIPMQRAWGAVWKLNSRSRLSGPFSFRLTTNTWKKTLEVNKVIPIGWKPGATYQSNVNFGIN